MKIDIKLLNNTLAAEEVQAEQVNKVIDGFFGLLQAGLDNIQTNKVTNIRPTVTMEAKNTTEVAQKITETLKKETASQNPQKILSKVNGTRSLNVPIGEIIESKQEEEQTNWKTGIRYNNEDEPRYQTKYWCDCGNTGKRYVPKDSKYVHCHECNQKLIIEPATLKKDEHGLPERDQWGNFYIARELYEVTGD